MASGKPKAQAVGRSPTKDITTAIGGGFFLRIKGDAYDNALADSVIGLFKKEIIRHAGPWEGPDDVELATFTWVWWFNKQCLMAALGYLRRRSI